MLFQKICDQPLAEGILRNEKLIIYTKVANQYINYSTDLSLVNEVRMMTEVIIDLLWKLLNDRLPVKQRSYRMVAHKQ